MQGGYHEKETHFTVVRNATSRVKHALYDRLETYQAPATMVFESFCFEQ